MANGWSAPWEPSATNRSDMSDSWRWSLGSSVGGSAVICWTPSCSGWLTTASTVPPSTPATRAAISTRGRDSSRRDPVSCLPWRGSRRRGWQRAVPGPRGPRWWYRLWAPGPWPIRSTWLRWTASCSAPLERRPCAFFFASPGRTGGSREARLARRWDICSCKNTSRSTSSGRGVPAPRRRLWPSSSRPSSPCRHVGGACSFRATTWRAASSSRRSVSSRTIAPSHASRALPRAIRMEISVRQGELLSRVTQMKRSRTGRRARCVARRARRMRRSAAGARLESV